MAHQDPAATSRTVGRAVAAVYLAALGTLLAMLGHAAIRQDREHATTDFIAALLVFGMFSRFYAKTAPLPKDVAAKRIRRVRVVGVIVLAVVFYAAWR